MEKDEENLDEIIEPKFFLLSRRVIGAALTAVSVILTSFGIDSHLGNAYEIANGLAMLFGVGLFIYGHLKKSRPLSLHPKSKDDVQD